MDQRWTRPLLCRLCRCPVAGKGVLLSRLDRPKLSEWWLKHLDTDLDDEEAENEWICQFCCWDARLEHESTNYDVGHKKCDWWTCQDTEDLHYIYYLDNAIGPCSVKIAVLDKEEIFKCQKCEISFSDSEEKKQHDKKVHRQFKCIYCTESKSFNSIDAYRKHI